MPLIETSIIVREDRKKIYKLLKNIGKFPKFIKDIKDIRIIKREPHRAIVNWEVMIDQVLIMWKEEDLFDNVNYIVRFKMLEGDYNKYEGEWRLIRLLKATKIILSVNIDWGAPALVAFPEVKKILMKKTKKSLKLMLIAIKKKMESSL